MTGTEYGNLCLGMNVGDTVLIGDDIEVRLSHLHVNPNNPEQKTSMMIFRAPLHVKILRAELKARDERGA